MNMIPSENDQPEELSKTQRKKNMLALQKLGETLVGLPESQLQKMPLSEDLLEAIRFTRSLKSHEAKRRHLQYIGKLMRDIDPAPIEVALKKIQVKHEEMTSQFHEVEEWREKLIREGDAAIQAFIEIYSSTDRQALRNLVRKAQHDHAQDKKTGGEIELFRYLRGLLYK